jgi:hypothetical protein
MKTVKAVMLENLVNQGMSEKQAKDVMVKAEAEMDTMKGNWNKEADGYPQIVIKLAWMNVKTIALEWTNENVPEAWFKPMFELNKA